MLDAIVVGSGPGGTACAHQLRGRRVLVLDVGHRPDGAPDLHGNVFELRAAHEDLFGPLIGEKFEGLHNLYRRTVSLKLKSPHMTYITRRWDELAPVASDSFEAMISLAEGGLANAWGAGAYRFNAEDLRGFPIGVDDLAPYYDELTGLIGICGASDDLDPWFGTDAGLLPPLRLSEFFEELYGRYRARRESFRRRGIAIGLPRLAVLSREHRGRSPYAYENLEFFRPHDPAVYNPAFTLREMVAAGEVEYRPGFLVTSYRETPSHVEVHARDVATGAVERFEAQQLFLGAGALNSARIVLASAGDFRTRLPLLDNPMGCVAILQPGRIGAALDVHDSSLAQLNLVHRDPDSGETLQATLYGTNGPLRTDILFQFPTSAVAGLQWAKYLASAMGLIMIFYPDRPSPENFLQLREDGALRLEHAPPKVGAVEKRMIAAFRELGYLSAGALCRYPRIGSGMHYAGTLPMKDAPGRYETDRDGLLHGSRRVRIVDGGNLPTLPAKNLTLTIMANAKRVAARALETSS